MGPFGDPPGVITTSCRIVHCDVVFFFPSPVCSRPREGRKQKGTFCRKGVRHFPCSSGLQLRRSRDVACCLTDQTGSGTIRLFTTPPFYRAPTPTPVAAVALTAWGLICGHRPQHRELCSASLFFVRIIIPDSREVRGHTSLVALGGRVMFVLFSCLV